MHVGTRASAEDRAHAIRPKDFELPDDTPVYMHSMRLRGRVYPKVISDEVANDIGGSGYSDEVDEGYPSGAGYHVFPYKNNTEGRAHLSFLVHKSAIIHQGTEVHPRPEQNPAYHDSAAYHGEHLHVVQATRWMPSAGIFAPTTGMDAALFDGDALRPGVRAAVMERLDRCLRSDTGLAGSDWQSWLRVWLAGGSVSEWAGGRPNDSAQDLDVLVGLSLRDAQQHNAFEGMDHEQAAVALNAAFRGCFNDPAWQPDFGGTWSLTAYCNPAVANDITVIKPYAAWDLTSMQWAVRPPHLPQHSAGDFAPGVMDHAQAVLAQARAILRMDEPLRTREARDLWDHVHAHRCVAFGPDGTGWDDPGNVDEKALSYAPRHVWERIRELAHGPDSKTAATESAPVAQPGADASGVFLHGGPNRVEPGSFIRRDALPVKEFGRSRHVFFTTNRGVAEENADQRNGRGHGWVHTVEPTGPYEADPEEPDSWKSEHPLRVVSVEPGWYNGTSPHPPVGIPKTARWEPDVSASREHGIYLRFGHWPADEKSANHVTGWREEGVSAYEMGRDGEPADPDPYMERGHQHDEDCDEDCDLDQDNDDYGNDTAEEMRGRVQKAERNRHRGEDIPGETAHLVRGEMVGLGHDAEPLLKNVKRVGDWIDHRHLLIPGAEKHRLARDPGDDGYEKPELPRQPKTATGPQLDVQEYEGETGNGGHITRTEQGMIPTSAVAGMRGAGGEVPGEHRNRQGAGWEDFKQNVARNGIREPLFITVDHGQEPRLSEGSHRRDAAVELGLSHVPAVVRYYGHAERQGTVTERMPKTAVMAEPGDEHGLHEDASRLGTLYHSTPFPAGFPHDEWVHVGDRRAAEERANYADPRHYGLPADSPVHIHSMRLRGRVYPRVLDDDTANDIGGYGRFILGHGDYPPGDGYHVFPYENRSENRGHLSFVVHRSAIDHQGTEVHPRSEFPYNHAYDPPDDAKILPQASRGQKTAELAFERPDPAERPHQAAVHQAQAGTREAHPGLTRPLPAPDQNGMSAVGAGILGRMLADAGVPRDKAAGAFVIVHPHPEWQQSQVARIGDRQGVALHPGRWDAGTVAHEGAHLADIHHQGLAWEDLERMSDEDKHGPGFTAHYARMLDAVSPGAGQDFLSRHADAAREVGGMHREAAVSGGPWYHGTQHDFSPGEHVTSPASRGTIGEWNASDPRYSYASTDKLRAWHLAIQQESARPERGPGRVFEVHPTGDMEPDPVDALPSAFRTSAPMRVGRELPREEIRAAQDDRQRQLQEQNTEQYDRQKSPHPFTGSEYGCGECGLSRGAQVHGEGTRREAVKGYDGLTDKSAMIYLDLPPGTVRPVPGGVDDHHVTVVYLGKNVSDEAFAEACRRAQEVAARHAPMDAVLEGIDIFPPSASSDGKVPAFVPAYIAGIGPLRRELEDLSGSEHKDYRPHVSLAYLEEGDGLPAPHPAVKVRFTRLHVRRGDDVRSYPLGGMQAEGAKAKSRRTWYHGTDEQLHPGDELVPGAESGTSHHEHVYVTNHAYWASTYASARAVEKGQSGRGHVYEVEPHGEPEKEQERWSYRVPGARIVREVTPDW